MPDYKSLHLAVIIRLKTSYNYTTLAYVLEVTVIYFLYVPINYVNPLLFLDAYFVFFELTVFSITVFTVCSAVTFAFVICSNKESSIKYTL